VIRHSNAQIASVAQELAYFRLPWIVIDARRLVSLEAASAVRASTALMAQEVVEHLAGEAVASQSACSADVLDFALVSRAFQLRMAGLAVVVNAISAPPVLREVTERLYLVASPASLNCSYCSVRHHRRGSRVEAIRRTPDQPRRRACITQQICFLRRKRP
jgi:hypothetical protein